MGWLTGGIGIRICVEAGGERGGSTLWMEGGNDC